MNPANSNLINAVVLVAVGAWGFFGADSSDPRFMTFIFGGTVLFVMTNSIRFHNSLVRKIAMGLTLLLTAYAAYLFYDSIGRINATPLFRSALILLSCIASFVFFLVFRKAD
jgi:hypothetical protein